MKACVTTSHLYGMGGGAKAVFWIVKGLHKHGSVTVFTKTAIPDSVIAEMPKGVMYANWYPGCSAGYDVHVCIDHFNYEPPMAKRNLALVFHPHRRNVPPEQYELWAISRYTQAQIKEQWGRESLVFYPSVDGDLYSGQKAKRILHISRFSAPNQYADKGHRHMIRAFKALKSDWEFVLAGSTDPAQGGYLSSLMAEAAGANIRFAPNLSRKDLCDLLASSSIYWHMTGIGAPDIPSAQEHLGITTIEGMASGCVPIVLGTGGQPEIVQDRISGVLVRDVDGLVKTTDVLMSNLGTWALLQQQALLAGQAWLEGDWYYDQFAGLLLDGVDMTAPVAESPILNYGMDNVDVIIPIYNSVTIGQCLDRIPAGPNVIVVDNGSDAPVTHNRIDQYIRLEENRGFAGGNMAGFEISTRPVVLALNDDCIPPDNSMWLTAMLLTLSKERCAVVGAKLLYPDGRLQHAGVYFDFHRKDIGFHRLYGVKDHPNANIAVKVPAVTGACLLCKREFFDMHPELYPYGNYEDAHLCLDVWRRGYEVWYQPAASLTHIEAVTKRALDIDFTSLNRKVFVEHWRTIFLDSEEMNHAREVNT